MKKATCIVLYVLGLIPAIGSAQKNHSVLFVGLEDKTSPEARFIQVFLERGAVELEHFFADTFLQKFEVRIHPDRNHLDSVWQHEWQMPEFHSECWMVASGIATKLDLLDPAVWPKEGCEHRWEDSVASFQLLKHELCHVFHGQRNPSPDFSQVEGIDWFVEGLAVYSSGQCDGHRLKGVQEWIKQKESLPNLDVFWSGKHKYGLSGSMVMYLDQTYGRKKLSQLLCLRTKAELLDFLHCSEAALLSSWNTWIRQAQW
ncbi:MAG: hypothetical protein JNN28_21430 [Saprospiraceae bacterium]|nr:hypothetical protein [Saprospiraceae bacterium]